VHIMHTPRFPEVALVGMTLVRADRCLDTGRTTGSDVQLVLLRE
jgi:hypothetical protein